MPKRSPEEVLKSIEETSPDEAMESVLSMTPEERRRELEAAGVDLRDLRAKAAAWRGKPAASAAPPPAHVPAPASAPAPAPAPARAPARVIPLRPWLRSAVPLAAAAVVLGLVVARWLGPGEEPIVAHGRPPDDVAALREKAVEECNAERWRACLDHLDQADRDDPQGGAAPPYPSMRARAEAALRDAGRE